jgi:phosphatidylglycerol:prolipoprotein diacylglycerol transferase
MHPILFEIPTPWGDQPIYAYGVLLGLSLIVGWQLSLHLCEQAGIEPNAAGDVYLTSAIVGLIGARALYIFANREDFESASQWIDLRNGGLIAYGGLITGFISASLQQRWRGASVLNLADCAAPAIAVGLFLTRIGCYLYGCDYGVRLPDSAPTWLAKLGTFPRWDEEAVGLRGSPAWLHHVSVYGLSRDSAFSYPVHPTQLYEGLLGLVLAGVCLRVLQKRAFVGQVLLVLCIGYGVSRFLLDYLRDDPERGMALGFSTTQLISMLLVPLAAIVYSLLRKPAHALHSGP